ncbi:MAG TPA: 5'-nucleotidase C-terminal domain-containing protein [Candidatus Lachnoclostridium stercoripullorum]|uniref:5'-nucleotidase C-terminal domain-containing protein n=1 Tax=Candidatus Lachnoclostridium stercoripullorum TaxID=2838635 RepID=A0A9D1W521_9FIRM|nr:5'-nucleotidase C-terminal domain-containing protein [Candidatus Lachnoclostridium stercoripullorum]
MRDVWKKRILSLALTAAMVLGAGAPALAAETPDQEIIILYTNDVHCGVTDNIGYAGLALYEKQMKEETPYVALVDAGDAIQGAPIGTLSEGGDIVSIMNQVGYDFAIPGNHEFDYGMDRLLELSDQLNCGYYSCNFTDLRTGESVFEPYKIMDFGQVQVAFVGATTPESFTKSTPKYFQDDSGNYIYGFCEDETGQALYSRIQETVDEARTAGADYVILVGHLGNAGITPRWASQAVVANTDGIDAVIDGHSHETVASTTLKNKDGEDVLLTQTGTKLADIGKMTIGTDGTITAELVDQVTGGEAGASYTVQRGDSLSRIAKRELGSYNLWNVIYEANRDQLSNPNVIRPGQVLTIPGSQTAEDGKAEDPQTAQFIADIEAQFQETLNTVLATTSVDLTVNDPATGERRVRSGETNLGDLTADAYRYVLGAEIGFSNGGGIRDSIAAGNITYNDTLRVFPFGNMGCVAEVTGQQIKDALEMGARNYPEENGALQQVSGLTYTIDSSIPSSVQLDDKRNFVAVTGPYRVTDIMVNGEPLDLNRTYTLASHNYLLKDGGDGMTMFAGCNIVKDEVMADVDLLSAYVRDNLGGVVGEEYANPAGQGRILIK